MAYLFQTYIIQEDLSITINTPEILPDANQNEPSLPISNEEPIPFGYLLNYSTCLVWSFFTAYLFAGNFVLNSITFAILNSFSFYKISQDLGYSLE